MILLCSFGFYSFVPKAQSSLGVFPSDVVAGAVTRYLERHGPLFAGTASRCAAQMLECPDEDQKELGLLFCILSLPEPRQKVLWALLEMCSGLLKLSKSAWTPQSLSAVFEPVSENRDTFLLTFCQKQRLLLEENRTCFQCY